MKLKYKIIFFLLPLMLYMSECEQSCWGVHNPAGVDPPDPNSNVVEFLYIRVKNILNPGALDPTGDAATIWHPFFGGKNSGPWNSVKENQWQCDVSLEYSKTPYAIWLIDRKVEEVYGEAIAEDLYARKKGDAEWIKLYPEKNQQKSVGKWARFIFDNGRITIPTQSF